MKTRLQRETNVAAPESNTLFDELDLACWVFLQLVGKQYPIKAFQTLKTEKETTRKLFPSERTSSGSIRPSRSDSILYPVRSP